MVKVVMLLCNDAVDMLVVGLLTQTKGEGSDVDNQLPAYSVYAIGRLNWDK